MTERLTRYQQRIQPVIEQCLASRPCPEERLGEALRYAVLGGGKRVRAALALAAGDSLGAPACAAEAAACAVELIHAYSLVHDDLPAMDDDELRRGQPTCHIAFGEATAILAGDALQALAFELLCEAPGIDDSARLAMVRELTRASGATGMVGGQALDMAAEGRQIDQEQLERIHRHKTGDLIRASLILGALAANADEASLQALRRFGDRIGLAFQVQDDILDLESSTEVLGKTQGADQAHGKATYPALMGLDQAKDYVRVLYGEACDALETIGADTDPLRELAGFIIQRDR